MLIQILAAMKYLVSKRPHEYKLVQKNGEFVFYERYEFSIDDHLGPNWCWNWRELQRFNFNEPSNEKT